MILFKITDDCLQEKLPALCLICPYISLMFKADRNILGRSFAEINYQQIEQFSL